MQVEEESKSSEEAVQSPKVVAGSAAQVNAHRMFFSVLQQPLIKAIYPLVIDCWLASIGQC